jgi:mediator of replication checkpoint protein 1
VTALQDNEDDDLVISTDPKTTIKEEGENRRLKQQKQSMARRTVAQLAHVNPAVQSKKVSAYSPNRIRKDFPSTIQESNVSGSSTDLQQRMFAQAKEHAFREIRRKEEEWTKHGGRLAPKSVVPAESFECVVRAIAGKGLETVKAGRADRMEAESDYDSLEGEDEEWKLEMRGSASPEANEVQNDESETQETIHVDGDITIVAEEQDVDDSDIDNTKVHTSKRNLVLSDSEEEGIDKRGLQVPIFRRSSTSSGLATEDEYDKENNTKLMYDQGEDKENRMVVRHAPIFNISNAALSSPESSPRNFSIGDFKSTVRRPFQELLPEEGPKSFATSSSTQTFVSKLQQASPMASTLAPTPTLKPFLLEGSGFAGFSQFSQAGPKTSGVAPLQPGFSELFDSDTEKKNLPLNLPKDRFEEVAGFPFVVS